MLRTRLWIALGLGLPLVALLQAWTAGALIRSVLSSTSMGKLPLRDGLRSKPTGASSNVPARHDASDSVTKPRDGSPEVITAPAPPVLGDPLRAPRCVGVRVVATSQSLDPVESIAVVQGPNEPHGVVRRIGNTVGGRRIAFIGRNPREWSPSVWLAGKDGLCQAVLRDRAVEATPPSPAVRPPKPASSRPARTSPVLDAALAARVKKLGPHSYGIERSTVESILEQATKLLRSVKVRPTKAADRVIGFEVRRVAPGTLLDVLGFENGDVLQSVNGFELTGPAQALQAYARMRFANDVRVKVLRNRVPIELDYRIR